MADGMPSVCPKLDTWVDRLTLTPSLLNESPKKNDDNKGMVLVKERVQRRWSEVDNRYLLGLVCPKAS